MLVFSSSFTAETRAIGRAGVLVATVALLGGCALQKPPESAHILETTAPVLTVPAQWAKGVSSEAPVNVDWPNSFKDPQLNELITQALRYNTNLQAAHARMQQAATGVAIAGSALFPSLSAAGKIGTHMGGDNNGLRGWLVSSSWELDVWGRIRYGRRAAAEQYVAAQYDIAFAKQSLVAEVATGWFLAKEAAQQIALLRAMIADNEKIATIAKERWDIGAGSEQDVLYAQVNVATLSDQLEQALLGYNSAVRALEILTGHYPAAELEVSPAFPEQIAPIPTGLPAELLDRRPDILAAERMVAAQFNLVGSARAGRLPKLNLSAAVASLTSNFYQLKNINDPLINVGGNLVAPLYMGGELKARQDQATAQQREAMADYATAVLNAFQEVETTLNTLKTLARRKQLLEQIVRDTAANLVLSQAQFEVGQTGLYQVTTLQVDLSEAQLALLSVNALEHLTRIKLHLVLGGDFGMGEAQSAKDITLHYANPLSEFSDNKLN